MRDTAKRNRQIRFLEIVAVVALMLAYGLGICLIQASAEIKSQQTVVEFLQRWPDMLEKKNEDLYQRLDLRGRIF